MGAAVTAIDGVVTGEPTLPPAGATSQLSYSGTPRVRDGWTAPDEYVLELRNPLRRMEKFEEMGSADEMVRYAIDSRRMEMNSANWTLASEDKSDHGTEILHFIEDNLYPHLDNLIRWLGGGALQYGVGLVEPVFAWSETPLVPSISRGKVVRATSKAAKPRIWLAKLAHIRQRTIRTFKISVTGDLETVIQWVFNGQRYAQTEIPAEKILRWTYNQQGDDCWGLPPTRHVYKAWVFKTQIERLNVMHFDRFGTGIPVAEEGQGWSDLERKTLGKFLEFYRSGAHQYIIHPNGGKISILSSDGKMPSSALEWVAAYNLAIVKAFITHQSELANQKSSSRAMAETFYQQLEGIVQADCEDLANIINNQLIIPLVLWNYGPQDTYPAFAPSQRVRAGNGVGQIMQQLIAAGAIHPRPEDEAYLRDVVGLPAVAIETLQSEQATRDATAATIAKAAASAPADPNAPNADPNDSNAPKPIASRSTPRSTPRARGGQGDGAPSDAPKPKVAASRALTLTTAPDGTPDPATPRGMEPTSYRTPAYTAWEYSILRPDVLTRDLDLQTTRLAGEVQDVLHAIDANLEAQAKAVAAQGTAQLAALVRTIAVPDTLRTQLETVLFQAASRARAYGAQAVRNEIERQLGPGAVGPQRAPSLYSATASAASTNDAADQKDASPDDLRLQAEVHGAAADEIDRREQSARSAVLTALAHAAGAQASALAPVTSAAVAAALVSLSTGRTQQNVEGVVNVAFGIGRVDEADAIHEAATGGGGSGAGAGSGIRDANGQPVDIVAKVYSAVMDHGTCDECARWDGAEFPIDYPEDPSGVQCPNPRCAGGYDQCRCVFIYITDKESVPLVPASKGPLPIRGGASAA